MSTPASMISKPNAGLANSVEPSVNATVTTSSSETNPPTNDAKNIKTKSEAALAGVQTLLGTATTTSASQTTTVDKPISNSSETSIQIKPKLVIFVFGGDHTDPSPFLIVPDLINKCGLAQLQFAIGEECNSQTTSAELKKDVEDIEKEEPILLWLVENDYTIGSELKFDFVGKEASFVEFINKNNNVSGEEKKWWIDAYRTEGTYGKNKDDENCRPLSYRIRSIYYGYIRKIAFKLKSDFVFQLENEKTNLYALEEGIDLAPLEDLLRIGAYKKEHEDARINNMAINIRKMIDENLNKNEGIIVLFNLGMAHLNRLCAYLNIKLNHYDIEIHPIQLLSTNQIIKTKYGEAMQKNLDKPTFKKTSDALSKVDDIYTKEYAIKNPTKKITFSQGAKSKDIICPNLDRLIEKTIKECSEANTNRQLYTQKLGYQQFFIENIRFIMADWETRFAPNTQEYQLIQQLANSIKGLSSSEDIFRGVSKILTIQIPKQLKPMCSLLAKHMKKYKADHILAQKKEVQSRSSANTATAASGTTSKSEVLHSKEDGKGPASIGISTQSLAPGFLAAATHPIANTNSGAAVANGTFKNYEAKLKNKVKELKEKFDQLNKKNIAEEVILFADIHDDNAVNKLLGARIEKLMGMGFKSICTESSEANDTYQQEFNSLKTDLMKMRSKPFGFKELKTLGFVNPTNQHFSSDIIDLMKFETNVEMRDLIHKNKITEVPIDPRGNEIDVSSFSQSEMMSINLLAEDFMALKIAVCIIENGKTIVQIGLLHIRNIIEKLHGLLPNIKPKGFVVHSNQQAMEKQMKDSWPTNGDVNLFNEATKAWIKKRYENQKSILVKEHNDLKSIEIGIVPANNDLYEFDINIDPVASSSPLMLMQKNSSQSSNANSLINNLSVVGTVEEVSSASSNNSAGEGNSKKLSSTSSH